MQPISAESERNFSYSVDAGAGRKLTVKPEGQTALFKVEFTGGGQLPLSLSGRFTSMNEGIKAVQRYLKEREQRPPSHGGQGKRSTQRSKEVNNGES